MIITSAKGRKPHALSIALRKTAQEMQNRPMSAEKAIMTEMSARIKNMLSRDPELKNTP